MATLCARISSGLVLLDFINPSLNTYFVISIIFSRLCYVYIYVDKQLLSNQGYYLDDLEDDRQKNEIMLLYTLANLPLKRFRERRV